MTLWVNTVSMVIAYIMKMWCLHLSIFTKNCTCCFWLFNSILWLSCGPHTHGLCSWMVGIERCLRSELPRTAKRRTGRKNLRGAMTRLNFYWMWCSIAKACTITWVWHDNVQSPLYSLKFTFSQFKTASFLAPFLKSPLRSLHSEVFI